MTDRPPKSRPTERDGGVGIVHLVWCVTVVVAVFVLNLSGVVLFSDSEARTEPRSMRDNPGAYRTHYFGGK